MSSDVGLGRQLRFVFERLQWRSLRVRVGRCPICGPSVIVRLEPDQLGTRCVRCGASPIAMGIVHVIRERSSDLGGLRVYEASSRGPLHDFLRRAAGELVCSELFDGVRPGDVQDGVRCEDLQSLTFPDAHFDLCTSTEVLEHVPDDRKAFRELHRVLRPGGALIFTVPLMDAERTVERTERVDGAIRHRLPPTYHDDEIRGSGRVLVHRDYGRDVVDRLREAGFEHAELVDAGDPSGMGHRSIVVLARRSGRSSASSVVV